jgi:NarL family two-component system response regulator LiaR
VSIASIEIYGGLTAAISAVLGIWLGLKLTGRQERIVVKEVPVAAGKPFIADESNREHLGNTRRELEILELIAQGMSNREIRGKALCEREHGQDSFKSCF